MQITLNSPLDMHLHLREGKILQQVAPYSSDCFAGAVIMPNLVSPVDSLNKVQKYRKEVETGCRNPHFTPYMTLFFRNYSIRELEQAKEHILGIKLYPAGITTRSEKGVTDFNEINETLSYMQDLEIPLMIHGETDGFVMDRERDFCKIYRRLAEDFPKLHIIMEHITTAEAVDILDQFENISATVTLHHLLITLDDVIGNLMEPDLFCKPIAKTPRDRKRLLDAVLSGHEKIMFGSDSAPHPRHKKECCGCAAGIFSAPVALPMLADIFEKDGKMENLQGFISDIACKRYGIEPVKTSVTLSKKTWRVPDLCNSIKPFGANLELAWQVTSVTPG